MTYKLLILVLLLLIAVTVYTTEEKKVDVLNSTYNNMPCEVYFFKFWSTYQHPVTPKTPLEYEAALNREGFYRAWMCNKNNKSLFSYFEGIENKLKQTKLIKPDNAKNTLRFYEYNNKNELGNEISASDTINLTSFYASLPNIDKYIVLIKQKKGISYEYIYDDKGKPIQAIITDFDGNVKTLDL